MSEEFQNKTALITGGASGIGRETALAFARKGANVAVCDIDETGGMETINLIENEGSNALFVKVNVKESDSVQAMVAAAVTEFGSVDFAVNSAGVLSAEARTGDYPEDDWQRLIDINLTGVFLSMKYEIRQMLHQGSGIIVNLASIAGIAGFPKNPAYVASKHGVVGLTKTAAIEYARKGIRINAVCPGYTQTPMAEEAIRMRPELKGQLTKRVPLGRLGTSEEIAAAIIYLCSENAGFMIGHALVLDGGITAM